MVRDRLRMILRPLEKSSIQSYLGTGVHTLGLLGWILEQVGRADVYVSTYSTSEDFLSGFLNLRKRKLVGHAVLLADVKASRKTAKLEALMSECFDEVYLGENHSKVVLVQSEAGKTVSVVTSQNQTYGGRAECTVVSTSPEMYYDIYCGFDKLLNNSVKLNGIHGLTVERDRTIGEGINSCLGDFRPFGLEE